MKSKPEATSGAKPPMDWPPPRVEPTPVHQAAWAVCALMFGIRTCTCAKYRSKPCAPMARAVDAVQKHMCAAPPLSHAKPKARRADPPVPKSDPSARLAMLQKLLKSTEDHDGERDAAEV